MANDMNANESDEQCISVRVRLNKSNPNPDTRPSANLSKHLEDNYETYVCSESKQSIDSSVEKCIAFALKTMKQKSKQILICIVFAIIATLLAALRNG